MYTRSVANKRTHIQIVELRAYRLNCNLENVSDFCSNYLISQECGSKTETGCIQCAVQVARRVFSRWQIYAQRKFAKRTISLVRKPGPRWQMLVLLSYDKLKNEARK